MDNVGWSTTICGKIMEYIISIENEGQCQWKIIVIDITSMFFKQHGKVTMAFS